MQAQARVITGSSSGSSPGTNLQDNLKRVRVPDLETAELNIEGNAFHPEWNYTISPNQQQP